MEDLFTRFDMSKAPTRQWKILRDFIKIVSNGQLKKHKTIVRRFGIEGLKPPYLLLCNHNAFFDFFVAANTIYPARANYVVAIDGFTMPMGNGFISRESLMRAAGCICKRKFTNDLRLIRQLKRIIENKDVAVIYPEARYSLCGTNAVLPESLGKLCKILSVPVVTLICHGHHINSPFWHLGDKGVRTEAEFCQLLSSEDVREMSADEIFDRVNKAFEYDDFKWLRESDREITTPDRAEGLHKVLYQCPACLKEYKMHSSKNELYCEACGKRWIMDTKGVLKANHGKTEFPHVPDWYEWERKNVRKEIKDGTYFFTSPVHVASLPNSKGYIDLGKGTMTHDMNGFHVSVSGPHGDFQMEKPAASMYSCHIEYEYLGKYGDCVDLNTLEDTWYTYPECEDFSVTKMALATEELFQHYQ